MLDKLFTPLCLASADKYDQTATAFVLTLTYFTSKISTPLGWVVSADWAKFRVAPARHGPKFKLLLPTSLGP